MSETNQETTTSGEDLAAIVAELRAELNAERAEKEKVKNKNKELVSEKQVAKQAADDAALDAAEKSGDIEALKASHARALRSEQEKREAADAELRTIRVDNEITRAYNSVGRPELAEQFIDWAKNRASYENGSAMLFDKPIGDAIGEYLNSEKGAHFRRASDNSGSGATGGQSTSTTTAFSEGEYIRRYQLNPIEAKQWATANGQAWITKD